MGTTKQALYEKQLKQYNAAVESNKRMDSAIKNLQLHNQDIQEKIKRLQNAKKQIESQDDELNIQIQKLSQGPNTEQFHGKLENEYWTERKMTFKNEVIHYINGLESIVNQINKKIAHLEEEIGSNNLRMNLYRNMKTNPILPVKPNLS